MKEKVKVNMLSVIATMDGDARKESERNENEYIGELLRDGDGTLLSFSEATEGGKVFTEIKIKKTEVVVRRRGAIGADMVFCEGERKRTVYKVSPYGFDMEIFCKRMKVMSDDRSGRIDLLYEMNFGGENRSARMKVTWKKV